MINLNKQIKTIYNDWGNDPYIYEKDKSGKYHYITYKEFIEKSLGIAKYLLDNNYKNKINDLWRSLWPRNKER